MRHFEAKTSGVRIRAMSKADPHHQVVSQGMYFFRYTINIRNESDDVVQLLGRRWTFRDAQGKVHEVEGEGVVGEQPVLYPGEEFSYTSGCPLDTPYGDAEGSYRLIDSLGRQFEAQIPNFPLQESGTLH